jgi:S1-C subfamily serine protease
VGLTFLWIFFEAGLLSTWGTTPGKWIFHTTVRSKTGAQLDYSAALTRSANVWARGMGIGIPIVTLFTLLRGYSRLKSDGETSWDRDGNSEVHHKGTGLVRLAIAFGAAAAIVGLIFLGIYVGDLEEEQNPFADRAASEVDTSRRRIESWVEAEDGSVSSLTKLSQGELANGDESTISVSLAAGLNAVAVAGCDSDCLDLDLAVRDEEGNILASDQETDARPWVFFSTEEGESYDLVVSMMDCQKEPCATALQVFEIDFVEAASGSSGTCFSVSPDGLVMTSLHVVEGADKIEVHFPTGDIEDATLIRSSAANDVALLGTSRQTTAYLAFASSESLAIGDHIFTIGYPAIKILGTEPKFTEGSISALSGPDGEHSMLQMSVPIQPGNSGGPLLNERGEVVGIVTAKAAEEAFERETGALPQAVNWAVKSAYASPLLDSSPPHRSATGRTEAIAIAREAICMVESSG